MSRELVILEEAELDTDDIWFKYDSLSLNLGRAFLEDLLDIFENIQEFPEIYQVERRFARRAVMHRFPCTVLYAVFSDRTEIVAVFHSHADREPALRRLKT